MFEVQSCHSSALASAPAATANALDSSNGTNFTAIPPNRDRPGKRPHSRREGRL
jgi:hypothetical protein